MFLVILVLAVSFFFLFVCLFVLFVLFVWLGGGEQYMFRCFSTIQSIDSRCNSTLILR